MVAMNRDFAIAADHDHLVNPRPCDPPQSHLNQSIAKATNSREPFPPAIEPERGMVEAGVLHRLKRNRGVTRSARPGAQHKGISIMKIIIIVTAGLFATLSVAAAADLPRKEPPPVAAAPIGKYPVGKYPVGKYPVGKYPQPVVTKG